MILPHLVGLSQTGAAPAAEGAGGDVHGQRVTAAVAQASECGVDEATLRDILAQWEAKFEEAPPEEAVAALEAWAREACGGQPNGKGKSRALFWVGGGLLLAGAVGGVLYWRSRGDGE